MIAAVIIGFVGSMHCVGMCGPLNLLVLNNSTSLRPLVRYHGGRIAAYALLGVFLGVVGQSLAILKIQQITAFTLGFTLLALYTVPRLRNRLERFYYHSVFFKAVHQRLTSGLSGKNRWLISGLANGFLPCGLTYVAAASAIASGGLSEGILFMIFFGLGTVPALLLVAVSGNLSAKRWRTWVPRAVSFVAVLSGSLLMLRSLLITLPDFNSLVHHKAAALITICGLN